MKSKEFSSIGFFFFHFPSFLFFTIALDPPPLLSKISLLSDLYFCLLCVAFIPPAEPVN
jgi:hypothetical protein